MPTPTDAVISPKFYFLTVFWGEGFRSLFIDFCLPSLLAEHNIPALKNKADSRFVIVTTEPDWAVFRAHPIHDALARHIEPVFVPMPSPAANMTAGEKLLLSSAGHKAATQLAFENRACAMIVAPDVIFSDGSVAALQRRAEAGIPLVMALGLRAEQDGLTRQLREEGRVLAGAPLSIPGREAVALLMRHMHSELKVYEWDRDYFTDWPVTSFWRIPDGSGMLVHSLGFTPIYADYRGLTAHRTGVLDSSTIDGAYLFDNFGRNASFDVVQDSDELMQLSMTREAVLTYYPLASQLIKRLPVIGDIVKLFNLRIFAAAHIDPLRRAAFKRPIRLHCGDITDHWLLVERRAATFVERGDRQPSRAERLAAVLISLGGATATGLRTRSAQPLRSWVGTTLQAASPSAYRALLGIVHGTQALLRLPRFVLGRIRFLVTHPRRGTRRIGERLGLLAEERGKAEPDV